MGKFASSREAQKRYDAPLLIKTKARSPCIGLFLLLEGQVGGFYTRLIFRRLRDLKPSLVHFVPSDFDPDELTCGHMDVMMFISSESIYSSLSVLNPVRAVPPIRQHIIQILSQKPEPFLAITRAGRKYRVI
jgi:hypothetical protein